MNERNLKIDNMKGVLILLVVIGHMLLSIHGTTRGVTNLFYLIYTFHMPAFVFLSGLFAQHIYTHVPKAVQGPAGNRAQRRKHRTAAEGAVGKGLADDATPGRAQTAAVRGSRRASRAATNTWTEGHFNWKRCVSVLWLYLLFQTLVFFSEIPAYGRTTRFPDYLHVSGAPWYLLALLLWYLMIPFFDAYRGRVLPHGLPILGGLSYSLIVWCLMTIMSLAGGYLVGLHDFLALDRVIAFAPFFFAGYFLGPERLMKLLGVEPQPCAEARRVYGATAEDVQAHTPERDVRAVGNTAKSRRKETSSRKADRRGSLQSHRLVGTLTVLGLLAFLIIGTQSFDHLLPYRNVVYGAWYYRFHPEENPAAFPAGLATHLWLLRLAWMLMAGLMSFAVLVLMPNRQVPLLTMLGQRTLQIYILHRPIRDLLLAAGVITAVNPENPVQVLALIGLSVVVTVLLSAEIFQKLLSRIQNLPFCSGGRRSCD